MNVKTKRQLNEEIKALKEQIANIVKPPEVASLEDSNKLKAEIASLQDSVKQKDAEFATLHDEIATLNDKNKYLESNEYLKEQLLKLTEEGFDKLGTELFPERATVEDSGKITCRAALKAVYELMGDTDLPDNGEISGAAVSDMVRAAIGAKMKDSTQDRAEAARDAHNVEVAGSSPAPATTSGTIPPAKETTVTAPVADSQPETAGEKWWREIKESVNKEGGK